MEINFPEENRVSCDVDFLSFKAVVDEQIVSCKIPIEILQDLNPENKYNIEQTFKDNRVDFVGIAEKKIRNSEILDHKIFIDPHSSSKCNVGLVRRQKVKAFSGPVI